MYFNLLFVVPFVVYIYVCVCEKPEHTIKKSSWRINTTQITHTHRTKQASTFNIISHTPPEITHSSN